MQTLGFDILQLKLKKKDFLLDYLITTIEVLDNYYDVGLITDGRLVHEIEVLKSVGFEDITSSNVDKDDYSLIKARKIK